MAKIKSYNEFADFNQIDMLGYGNEALKHRKTYMVEEEPLVMKMCREKGILEEFFNKPFPKNSSPEAAEELQSILKQQNNLTDKDIELIEDVEKDINEVIGEFLEELGLDDNEDLIKKIADFTDPLLYKLKNYYNRARPWQLARPLGIGMFQVCPTNAATASYPSGHALDSYMIASILGQKYPEHAEKIAEFCDKVAHTRVQGGIHYQSDQDFSREICDKLCGLKIVTLDSFI
jgi:hypothetical protein